MKEFKIDPKSVKVSIKRSKDTDWEQLKQGKDYIYNNGSITLIPIPKPHKVKKIYYFKSFDKFMNSKDFKDLTGENPEDMFGGDYENVWEEMEEAHAKDECAGCPFCGL